MAAVGSTSASTDIAGYLCPVRRLAGFTWLTSDYQVAHNGRDTHQAAVCRMQQARSQRVPPTLL